MAEFRRSFRFCSIITFSILFIAVLFLIFTAYFKTHFYPGTQINEVGVSFLTTEEADTTIAAKTSAYALALIQRGNVTEQIQGAEIGLRLDPGSASYKREQNRSLWIFALLLNDKLKFDYAYTFEEGLFAARCNELNCRDIQKVIEPKNADLVYSNGVYHIVKEIYGNKVDDKLLIANIRYALKNGIYELDLEQADCYLNPTIRWDSPKIRSTKKTAESYLVSKVTYEYPGGIELVNEDEISSWIEFDQDMNLSFNEKKIRQFLNRLAVHYDTWGKERDFVTSSGEKIKIGGGDYGWKVDVEKEIRNLIDLITSGRTVSREPEYSQRGVIHAPNDIGPSYVEIDLTKQYLWYYNAGILIAQGAVVSGNIKKGYRTPEGIYSLKYKVRNAVLRGEDYRSSVSYWMPFNQDIGIHDAPWRNSFGSNIYLTRGSHGCINAPVYLAETIFKRITAGTPIICYY